MTQYQVDFYLEDLFFPHNSLKSPISESEWQDWMTKWLNILELDLGNQKIYELSLILTDDEQIQNFNQQYRNQNQPTDVLSFAALEADFPHNDFIDSVSLGDVMISVQTAQKQAKLQGHSLKIELAWLASHGFLHLLGWDHPDEDSLKEMLSLQQFLLNGVALKPPSISEFFL